MTFTRSSFSLSKVALLITLLTIGCSNAFGQAAARPDRGTMPNGTYSVSDFENISLSNGNVNLSIPLAALPPIRGGKLSWTVSATYNSKLMDITRRQENADPLSWQPYSVDQILVGEGGWRVGGQYRVVFRSSKDDFYRMTYPSNSGVTSQDLNYLNNYEWRKVVLIMPDGAEHELRPTDLSPYPGYQDFLKGFYDVMPGYTRRYYSIDGSFLYSKITSEDDWTVYMKDGTQIIQTTDGIQRVQDTNGNKIKIFTDSYGTHYQDEQTGREIRVAVNPSLSTQIQVWYNAVGGTAQHIDINYGSTTVQGHVYQVNDWQPYGGETGGFVCKKYQQIPTTGLSVLRQIVLPTTEPSVTRMFEFSYNSDTSSTVVDSINFNCGEAADNYSRTASNGWGELNEVVTPTGAVINYTYKFDSIHALVDGTHDISTQSIETKTLHHDSTSDEWTYVIGNGTGSVTNPDGGTMSDATYFCHSQAPGCFGEKTGLSYRTISPFRTVDRHWTSLSFSGANSETPGGTRALNAVVDKEYTTLTDGSGNPLRMSAKAFSYDYNGNLIETREYDWFDPGLVSRDAQNVPTGIPGGATLLRTTNYSHYNQASTASSGNVYAKRSISTGAPLILDALKETTLGSGIVQLSYDGQSYGTAPTVGNLTSKSAWNDVDSAWITNSYTYYTYGNLATSTDGRGKVTEYFYTDPLLPTATSVRVDPQNGTGTQTVQASYDYYTGLVTSKTDVNGQTSTIDYTNQLLSAVDPFGRPGIVKSPSIGGQQHRVTTSYYDSTSKVVVGHDLNSENDKLLKTRTTVDQLGRPVLTEQTEDGTNYTISSTIAYRNMGSVVLTSSARKSAAASTDGWTRVTKDTAGRITEVATFGGTTQPGWTGTSGTFTGSVATTYDGEYTTVSDQVGKLRRSKTNALGQLVRVDEPNSSNVLGTTASPNQATSYAYDVYGGLTTVTQGSQTRTFTYDTLSRLRTAANPESGTTTYKYDNGNNLIVRTDARSISTHYEYDGINRPTRRWYNTDSSVSATTHTSSTTDQANFYYDSQSLPSGAPSYTRGSAVGRLVAQTYGVSTSTGDYFAYDVLGRVTSKYQRTGTVNYLTTASYSLSGALSSLTYPSGRTVTNSYDSAGRLTGVSGTLGDGTTRTYSTAITYMPTGAFSKEEFGTTDSVYNKAFYNSRGQLSEIRVSSTSGTDTSWNRGAIINFYSDQCWGMCSGNSFTDNNGNLQKQSIYIPNDEAASSYHMKWQQYSYDSLNRLESAREILDGGSEQWKQQFTYDRYGNRTINTGVTYGTGINNKSFTVDTATNRLGVPGGQSGVMQYDAAGNLTNDTYTGAGNRTYDGENKIVSAWGGNNQAQLYGYDVSGNRIKRTVDGVETWQVYGIGNELLAEYAASGAANSPQKEYGYRNGTLLVTATPRINVAAAANGSTATASQTHSAPYVPAGAINGDRKFYANNAWAALTATFPQWLQVDFSGSKTITEIDVFSVQNNSGSPSEPTESMTFNAYGVVAFEAQYWNGSGWVTVPGGSITGNNKVWKRIRFSPITTSKIRILISATSDNGSRLAEVEAWADGGSTNARVEWIVADQLGTPRMILDESGDRVNVKRHDYLPFGEELFAGVSGRSTAQGYAAGDGVRQQLTLKERDVETGLDYFGARYYASVQGRFTGSDPGKLTPSDPQNFNRYSYVQNNPLKFIDLQGRDLYLTGNDADYIVAELQNATGLTLIRDKKTGKVTIDRSVKRKMKGTSTWLANELIGVTGDSRVSVNIATVRDDSTVFFDSYMRSQLDVGDYNAFKKADPKFAIESLAHVIAEYYFEQLIPLAGTNSTEAVPAGGSRGPLTKLGRYDESHLVASEFESKVLSDFTGWWEKPFKEQRLGDTPQGTVQRFEFSSVMYDVVVKNNAVVSITKHEIRKPR